MNDHYSLRPSMQPELKAADLHWPYQLSQNTFTITISEQMPVTASAFMGTPLPRLTLSLFTGPLPSTTFSNFTTTTRPHLSSLRAITRKVSDIHAYPDLDKEVKRLQRARDKRAARGARQAENTEPRGFGDRPGIDVGPNGSLERTIAEREARHKHMEETFGPREISRRVMGMLDGGKADLLLHTLRARYLERMHKWALNEKVKLTTDIPHVYRNLIDEILLCDRLYYADNPQPRIRDAEYDELVMHLLELERCFPELIMPESPSQNVGHGAAIKSSKLGLQNELSEDGMTALESQIATVPLSEKLFPQYRHKALMLSLDNAYKYDDLVSFGRRAVEANTKLSAELKIDGVALSLEYRKGRLFSAATRGTGRIGDQITENVRASLLGRGIVEQIEDPVVPDFIVVRGEVYINPDDFKEINASLQRQLSNPRNAAAGALKHKNPLEARERRLRFIAYECFHGDLEAIERVEQAKEAKNKSKELLVVYPKLQDMFPTQSDLFERLALWGFGSMPKQVVCDTIKQAEEYADMIELEREGLPFEVDGVVFKFEDSAARAAAGHTARAPRGAIAYKFAAQSKVTELKDVVMQVSRNGLITPVAVLDPVRVGGAVLSRATLHNFDEVKRLEVAVGDKVRVQRGGDVIPKIVHVEEKGSSPARKPLEPPESCPSCQGEIISKRDEATGTVLVSCKNGENCHAQILGRLIHFSSKDALDIKGLGKKTADKLVKSGMVVRLSDLFRLTLDDVKSLEGFAEKSANLLYEGIRESTNPSSLERLLIGLGLPGVGRTGARALALEVKSLERLLEVSADESGMKALMSIPNFGERSAEAVFQYLQQDLVQNELKTMAEYMSPNAIVDEEDITAPLGEELPQVTGRSFVFTGKLAILSRQALKKWIRAVGGIVSTDVSHRTDYVVAGLDPGQKFYKAQRLKVKTLQEEEFLALFKPSDKETESLLYKPDKK